MARIPETGEMLLRQESEASIKLVPGIETMRRGQPTALCSQRRARFSPSWLTVRTIVREMCRRRRYPARGGFILQVRD